MKITLPESLSSTRELLTYRRAESDAVRPCDEVVSFSAVLGWLKGRNEAPLPLLVDEVKTVKSHGMTFTVFLGVWPDGNEGSIQVKGIRPIYKVTDSQ